MDREITVTMKLKHALIAGVAAFAIIAIGATALIGNSLQGSVLDGLDPDSYQAIHLDTGETYFGKIIDASETSVIIEDIYYFANGDKTKLIKHGREVHGPNDVMTINRERVLTAESLKDDSKVMQAILKYKQK